MRIKPFVKPIAIALVLVSSFALGARLSLLTKADAMETLIFQEQRLEEEIAPLVEEWRTVQAEKCKLIEKAGGVCQQDKFGAQIGEALASFR